ncbi:MAG: hypothetical protein ACRC5T_04330 [Cetobacterium sp.]
MAAENMNPFPYGTGEHLGYSLMHQFGNVELAAYVAWMGWVKNPEGSISEFLLDCLERFGIDVAQYCARYLDDFGTVPPLTEETKARLGVDIASQKWDVSFDE